MIFNENLWELQLMQTYEDFTRLPLNVDTLVDFIKMFESDIEIVYKIETSDALNLILLNTEDDYVFKKSELNWLRPVETIIVLDLSNDTKVIAIEIDSDKEDFPLIGAACIKLFQISNFKNALFIFKNNEAISFGVRKENSISKIDFIVTKLFFNDDSSELIDLINELSMSEIDEYEDVLVNYPRPLSLKNSKIYDGYFLGQSDILNFTDQDIAILLENIGITDERSSYEILLAADEALTNVEKTSEPDLKYIEDSETFEMLSEQAFNDAELMLLELLDN